MSPQSSAAFVADFRQAAPYIHYLSGKTIVLAVSSHVLLADKLASLAKDIQLLASLGVRLVLVHGTRQYLNQMMRAAGETLSYHRGWRITDEATLQQVKQACGMVRFDIEAALSSSPAQMPDRNQRRLRVASGNFLLAKPLGVMDGIDMGYTGRIRKVDAEAIQQRLNEGCLVLVSPLGQSLSGKSFNLGLDDAAQALAVTLKAEKLVFLASEDGVRSTDGALLSQLTAAEAQALLDNNAHSADMSRMLKAAIYVLENGVRRAHILCGLNDGSLIAELFTRQGSGTALAQSSFMRIRAADNHDIGDIIDLIAPLESAGILLPRNREYLENHIHEFSVLEHDCHVYGCVALKVFEQQHIGELACLVVSPDAQDGGYGELLLDYVLKQAKARGVSTLFALSTNTGDWFDERGFETAELSELPPERQEQYLQNKRRSKIYRRSLV
ncbi:amino-acid N-acetyltransferase [Paralysiella testudinis]|uniref:Amino-acid acetyltransferase n=1 Tax=Paralysiella testudinis TaxID=2809020 RepID=A0A892ZL62_9NEIS|nr:amino-acid N-acetyltransferase [Paralysiella testudinis]QRQ83180.1 amino-acid N-acetyltransferase [Paralysiella testudinis]